jgi:hypothetical protein
MGCDELAVVEQYVGEEALVTLDKLARKERRKAHASP